MTIAETTITVNMIHLRSRLPYIVVRFVVTIFLPPLFFPLPEVAEVADDPPQFQLEPVHFVTLNKKMGRNRDAGSRSKMGSAWIQNSLY